MQNVRGEAAQKDPRAVNRLIGLLESGLSPEEAAKKMEFEAEKAALEEVEGPDEEETFTDEIKIISQALAFRRAEPDDLMEIMRLLNTAYSVETSDGGEESFRNGDGMSVEVAIRLFDDKSYEWLVVEAPNGQEAVKDGTLLGVCVYSTDGVSRRNGEVEGKLGSIRILAVLPHFHGYCIGLRLLKRVESNMCKAGCVRSLACIPSVRSSLEKWFENRGYTLAGVTAYPAEAADQDIRPDFDTDDSAVGPEAPEKRHLRLLHFMRKLEGSAPSVESEPKRSTLLPEFAATEEYEPVTVIRLNGDLRANDENEEQQQPHAGVYVPGKMHLPPHWRHAAPQAAVPAPSTTTSIRTGSSDAEVRSTLGPVREAARQRASASKSKEREEEEEIPID